MLNLRYFDDQLPLVRQAELLERDRKKRLAALAREAQPRPERRAAMDRAQPAWRLPRLAFRRG